MPTLGSGDVQGRVTVAILGIDVGALLEKHLDDRELVGGARDMERWLAIDQLVA